LEYEIKRAKRYDDWTTLVRLAVSAETSDKNQEPQFAAEVFAINVLNIQLRDVDIPCRINNEFLILMPCTDEFGARIVCERLEKLFCMEAGVYEKVSFKLKVFIGMISLPSDKTLSSKLLMDGALQALDHARDNHLLKTVVYSDINK
jgi:GGDEF domain-containing protein